MNLFSSKVHSHRVKYFSHLATLSLFALHDKFVKHVLVFKTIFSL